MNDEQVLTHRKNVLFRNVGVAIVIAFAMAATFFGLQARRDRAAAELSARAATDSQQRALASARDAAASRDAAEERRREAETATARAQENASIAERNAIRADLRGRAAQALAALPSEPPRALQTSVSVVRESAQRFGAVPVDMQFSLLSGLLGAREAFRAPVRVLPTSMALTGDGSILAIGSLDLVMLYSPQGVLRQRPLAGRNAAGLNANAVAFSPDGAMLATASGLRKENCVRHIWNRAGRLLAGPLVGHQAPVRSVAFSPDSQMVATGAEDGSLSLWRADGVLLWSRQDAYDGSINALAFASNGHELLGGGGGSAPVPSSTPLDRTLENGIAIWSVSDGSRQAMRRTDRVHLFTRCRGRPRRQWRRRTAFFASGSRSS